jgi:hypothetical protein
METEIRARDGLMTRYDPRVYTSADEMKSRRILWALDYWQGKRANGSLPLRSQIDPIEMPRLLPYLMLIEVIAGRLRYRLVGTQVAAGAGYDFTGRHLDELQFANRDFYLGCYGAMLRTHTPTFGMDNWVYPDGRNGIAEFGMLPLSRDGQSVSHFLTVEDKDEVER